MDAIEVRAETQERRAASESLTTLVARLSEQLAQQTVLVEELTAANEELRTANGELKKQLQAEIEHNEALRSWAEQLRSILSAAEE